MKETKRTKKEAIPDIEQAHAWLLENDALMNFLNDDRGWSSETVKKMKLGLGVRYIRDEDQEVPCLMYPYFGGNVCTFVKYRTLPPHEKNFAALSGYEAPLYNQNAITRGMPYLVCVEGEADCLSLIELGVEGVVGVPGAKVATASWHKMLDLPEKIYLLFDNDEAGQAGARAFAERFGVEKFLNIVLPEVDLLEPIEDRTKAKDITEWLQTGKTKEDFESLLKSAAPFDIEGVSGLDDSLEELAKDMLERGSNAPKYDSPWPSLNQRFGGAEDGYLTIISAPMKTGKTSAALNWADYLASNKNATVFFECLEMNSKQLSRKWASYITRTDDTPGRSLMTPEVIRQAQEVARSREHDLLFGFPIVTTVDAEFERIKTVVRRYGIKVLVFDNLQLFGDLLMSRGKVEANRDAFLSQISKRFKAIAMELKIWVILIAQTKRLEEGGVAGTNSLEGTGKAGNDCDSMLIMNRTKVADVRKTDELRAMGGVLETNDSLEPELYILNGLNRFSGGGWVTLYIEGAISLIRERTTEETSAVQASGKTVNGIPFVQNEEMQAV